MTTYIENILVCLLIPLLLAVCFLKAEQRRFSVFVMIGMAVCLCSAYVSSFFMNLYAADTAATSIEIAPVCEEIMKLLPLLFYVFIFEPDRHEVIPAAIGIAVGFTTFENCCYITENGTADFTFLLIRGLSAGAVHILCGILTGFGLNLVWSRKWLAVTGTAGVLCLAISFHGIYNLLISTSGALQTAGYIFPSTGILLALIIRLFAASKLKTE